MKLKALSESRIRYAHGAGIVEKDRSNIRSRERIGNSKYGDGLDTQSTYLQYDAGAGDCRFK